MTEWACTPGQTVGPFLDLGLPYPGDSALVGDGNPHAVRLHGTVYDGAGDGVPDALVELWQPDGSGRIPRRAGSRHRDAVTFTGWGRSATDAAGRYAFTTVAPGSASAGRPPFFALTVFARGLLDRLFTRAYLPGGDLRADPLLASLDAERRSTMLCDAESGCRGYRFDIHLQGPRETVFLAYRDGGR
ncbi:protocatechuate 3,4-dioxygenase subunit alpha [Mycobacterium nebraskense]|uniref:Protocatechuate 3,4-dioxygenase subunit alpha n=1 Tax=Mycobacterium nebraskense TaxID=244292 RepID=A0A0F5NBU2_9MYCO|nr:protocatechuate 3,4-dioxygenase subunit alpha [Mycobacterium nebraskense]KKC04305.1 protocatechuate 3,4-dioxygenase [Mycobacterium nebraskense]KLO38282.1 protocatechuate 3,4-dioxygenase [Mycobacterium nebraskense]MBI2695225.1 protocatechuate 3,4-dioxygenase subunit alpha [Mycobacterium nebraskense]MCV7118845.1 protocatechuate 3,4-dioxygenase subunit alpha [Mycobacterium nebraskense]ORW20817.1 protocatechuate 3,4-dioxygenase subunit alpha [Mycobacterium nebraskense]